jgi:hypothetical protein
MQHVERACPQTECRRHEILLAGSNTEPESILISKMPSRTSFAKSARAALILVGASCLWKSLR